MGDTNSDSQWKWRDIRIYGDYKMTTKKIAKCDMYLCMTIRLISNFEWVGKEFSKLDLTQAHLQILLDTNSAECITITLITDYFDQVDLSDKVTS